MDRTSQDRMGLYRTIWRWHFYAGLFVVPMVLILALTGAVYLFKPQVERWEERDYRGFATTALVAADAQVAAATRALPGATFHSYRLPETLGDAALVHVSLAGDRGMRDVFVSPQGKVVGVLDPDARIMQIAHDIHGELLIGPRGSWIVELAASWAIVMILTGLYLWWPQGTGLAGVVWPRLASGKRAFWRDLHAVTGFWVAGLALVLLVTGLPWAGVWGSAFKTVRGEFGWVKGKQDWTIGGQPAEAAADEHAGHDHAAMMAADAGQSMPMPMPPMPGMTHDHTMHGMAPVTLNEIVVRAESEHLPFPVIVSPPGASGRFGAAASANWSVRSDTQNRPQRVSLTYDTMTGKEVSRETFADKHAIDRVVGYGVAWHEGQLFGWVNQLIGVLTALMLMTLAVSGFVLWRRRKPERGLGAPPLPPLPARIRGIVAIVLALATLLPMLALSLIAILLTERLILSRIPAASRWLGLAPA
ncbi:PepSY-associated TM helix domain-containing protein [Novosphingobium sp. JCM 18896]|uniref:PepSY-associated TM helix domain-containing protein n=1 Tax=Novosphingobium sp. JCM 18896 TaxID=2989731 RepID=UPI0022223123|nr:PepSY domain-containing protein [Novosphingobium sp. JCM 18896]MCW1429916.1 PepSY domain-containing protein [Novosphingobium sp. JCM 18896]